MGYSSKEDLLKAIQEDLATNGKNAQMKPLHIYTEAKKFEWTDDDVAESRLPDNYKNILTDAQSLQTQNDPFKTQSDEKFIKKYSETKLEKFTKSSTDRVKKFRDKIKSKLDDLSKKNVENDVNISIPYMVEHKQRPESIQKEIDAIDAVKSHPNKPLPALPSYAKKQLPAFPLRTEEQLFASSPDYRKFKEHIEKGEWENAKNIADKRSDEFIAALQHSAEKTNKDVIDGRVSGYLIKYGYAGEQGLENSVKKLGKDVEKLESKSQGQSR